MKKWLEELFLVTERAQSNFNYTLSKILVNINNILLEERLLSVKLHINNISSEVIDLIPHLCTKHTSNNLSCKIIKDGYYSRSKCFTSTYIILLKVSKWKCIVHTAYFTILDYLKFCDKKLLQDIYCTINSEMISLLIFKKTIIDWKLYQLIISLYLELHNFTLVCKHLEDLWLINLKYRIQQVNLKV